jgi:hypothetical protein
MTPLWSLFRFAWRDDPFSYIPIVPLVSAYFFYEKRIEIFPDSERWHLAGAGPIAFAILLYAFGASQDGRLA